MFSTGISYNEAESAIQKLDPSMRADYEKSLSDLRKAETVYAEEGRQAISYMGLALNLENAMQELAATKSLLDQEREKCQFLDRSIFPMLLLLCGFLSAFIIPLLAHSLSFSPLLAVAGSIVFFCHSYHLSASSIPTEFRSTLARILISICSINPLKK